MARLPKLAALFGALVLLLALASRADASRHRPKPKPSASPSVSPSPSPSPSPTSGWPDASNTGVPPDTVLHDCPPTITATGTYEACRFAYLDVRAADVTVTRSEIDGQVASGSTGLVISDSTIVCGCPSVSASDSPSAIQESNYTLLRVDLSGSAHGAAVSSNVTIQDSYIHGLGGNTDAHKDGIYSGDGSNVTIRHNSITCNDGPLAGCTSAIGLLTDFTDISYWTIDGNLLNTNGSYCFYASGGPHKLYSSNHITFTNNHFGQAIYPGCGFYGPVAYWDSSKPGMVWSGNVWDTDGSPVPPAY